MKVPNITLNLEEPPFKYIYIPFMHVRGGAHIVYTYQSSRYMLNMGEIRANHKRSILFGVTNHSRGMGLNTHLSSCNERSSLK